MNILELFALAGAQPEQAVVYDCTFSNSSRYYDHAVCALVYVYDCMVPDAMSIPVDWESMFVCDNFGMACSSCRAMLTAPPDHPKLAERFPEAYKAVFHEHA